MSSISPCRRFIVLLLCVAIAVFVSGCGSEAQGDTKSAGKPGAKSPPLVAVAQPVSPQSGQLREYIGTVESRNQISLVPQVAGMLVQVNASVGDKVTRGQVLAVVEDPQMDAQLGQAQATVSVAQGAVQTAVANSRAAQEVVRSRQQAVQQADAAIAVAQAGVSKARSDLTLAQTTLSRTQELSRRELIADQQLDQAVANSAAAQADLALAEAQIRSAQSRKQEAVLDVAAAREQRIGSEAQVSSAQAQAESLSQAARSVAVRSDLGQLRSPIDGTVVSRSLDPGAYVTPGNQSVIMVLADTNDLRVAFDLSETDLGLVQTGQAVQVRFDAFPDQPQKGVISGLAGGLDPASRTIRVEASIPQVTAKIRPGMLGRLTVGGASENLLAIPLPAVQSENGVQFVFIMGSDQKVSKRTVKVSTLQGDNALIADGLKLEDRVVVQGVNLVREGQEVRLEAKPGEKT